MSKKGLVFLLYVSYRRRDKELAKALVLACRMLGMEVKESDSFDHFPFLSIRGPRKDDFLTVLPMAKEIALNPVEIACYDGSSVLR